MPLRGQITQIGDKETISTDSGPRELVPIYLRTEDNTRPVKTTLWGKWTATADVLQSGMEILITNPSQEEFQNEIQYSTTPESYVVVEPTFLVDVTEIRSWVQCPRMHFLNKLQGVPLKYPVVKGTLVHEVFSDLLRGRDMDEAIEERLQETSLEIGLLEKTKEAVREDVRTHASAIKGWLNQGTLTEKDEWRSEYTLISPTLGLKGRADAIRRGTPVELKTGKNTSREPHFQDKVQVACYALIIGENGNATPETGTLLYTKNAGLDRSAESGDLSPAKDFSLNDGLLKFVINKRNELAAFEWDNSIPTGYEGNTKCEYCFEQDSCMVISGRLNQESKAGQIGSALPEPEQEYFDRWYQWIEEERKHTHREYAKLWTQTQEERANMDRALIDLRVIHKSRTADGQWEITAQRTNQSASKIKEGDMVLASDGDPITGDHELARVEQLSSQQILITAPEPVDIQRVDVYPSELSINRMHTALHDFLLTGNERRRDIFFHDKEPTFSGTQEEVIPNNDAQNRAVKKALRADDFALIHGPPGTGKTYTIAKLIQEFVSNENRVLLSAFTNRAVDNALDALRSQGFEDILRVGTKTGIRGDMHDLHLTTKGTLTEVKEQFTKTPVVAATTASCGSRTMRNQEFDVVIIDEASQLTEPDTLTAINRAEKFVLVGDHKQLPPVVRSENMNQSLFERLIDQFPETAVMLNQQYRMAQQIQAFSSHEFYDNNLRPANAEIATQRLTDMDINAQELPPEVSQQVSFIHVDGDTQRNSDTNEAEKIATIIDELTHAGIPENEIGVIAPYRAQVSEISSRLSGDITVDTVDRFQGSSKEIIIVSFVATDSLDGVIFEDYRRLNVALTRARKSLILVGDENALRSDDLYARMIEWANIQKSDVD